MTPFPFTKAELQKTDEILLFLCEDLRKKFDPSGMPTLDDALRNVAQRQALLDVKDMVEEERKKLP